MKKINSLLLLFFVLIPMAVLGQYGSSTAFTTFEPGKDYAVFGDKVKMRSGPGTAHPVIKIIKIGEKVNIVETTAEFMEYNGINTPWYKIKYRDQVGFVLGGLIAIKSFEEDNFTILSSLKQKEDYQSKIVLRILKDSNSYKEFTFDLVGDNFNITLLNSKGLKSITKLLEINYNAQSCGAEGGVSYFYFDGDSISHLATLHSVSEAGIFSTSESFIFPDDEGGIVDKIIYKKSIEEVQDEKSQWHVKTEESRILNWDGRKIFPSLPFTNN
jgi:hypothetical protein